MSNLNQTKGRRRKPRIIEPPSDGFWLQTPRGVVAHVTGDRNMSDKSAEMLSELIEAAYDYYSDHRNELRKTAPNEHLMAIPNSTMIAITELKGVAEQEPDYVKRVEKVMAAAVHHWMVVDEQEQFRAACGALLLTSPDQAAEIKSQLSALRTLSALASGVPIDFEAVAAESEAAPKPTIGLRGAFVDALKKDRVRSNDLR